MSSSSGAPSKGVVLVSIDGWGLSEERKGNAILNAKTPVMTKLVAENLFAKIDASGLAVGLPEGLMGNSEVGHLTMGSGRVVYQDLMRINLAIKNHELGKNKNLQEAFAHAKQRSGRVHFLGLVSDGGVHSHIEHLQALVAEAHKAQVPNAYLHFFADGRDTPPTSAVKYIQDVIHFFKKEGYGTLATLQGRYYAMDRDKRWDRIAIAYEALVGGKGQEAKEEEVIKLVEERYKAGENDEFLKPIIVNKEGLIRDGDVLIFFDFRSDRMRQIVEVFGIKSPFELPMPMPKDLYVVQMTQYNEKWALPILFPPQSMDNVLSEVISKAGLRQFHTAETEKYAHVTFFFNGGREIVFDKEDRAMVPSPKVATYDLHPEMNMTGVAENVNKAIATGDYAFVMCNLAGPDMVGHTGKYDATVTAVEACDAVIGTIYETCKRHNYTLVITADHGNAEEMLDENGNPKTSHTTNLIPFIVAGPGSQHFKLAHDSGGLSDVAPIVLTLLGLPKPQEMHGHSMIVKK